MSFSDELFKGLIKFLSNKKIRQKSSPIELCTKRIEVYAKSHLNYVIHSFNFLMKIIALTLKVEFCFHF